MTVIEQITEKFAQRLLNTTGASGVAQPLRLGKWTPEDNLLLLTMDEEEERVEELDCQGNPSAIAWKAPFRVLCIRMTSEDDTVPILIRKQQLSREVMRAITQPTNWETWDQLAIDTRLRAPENVVDEDGAYEAHALTYDVFYRHDENNPENVR